MAHNPKPLRKRRRHLRMILKRIDAHWSGKKPRFRTPPPIRDVVGRPFDLQALIKRHLGHLSMASHAQAIMDHFEPAMRALATADETEFPLRSTSNARRLLAAIQDTRPVDGPQAAMEVLGVLARAKGWSEADLADWLARA